MLRTLWKNMHGFSGGNKMQGIINTDVCYDGLHPAPTLCRYVLDLFAINKQKLHDENYVMDKNIDFE